MRYRVLGLVLAIASAGCIVDIEHVADPEAAFTEARRSADSAKDVPGKATEVHVLVYDPKDGTLVRVNVPFWLAKKMSDEDAEDGMIPASVGKRVHLADLERAGKGTTVEVEDKSGEKVLLWLR